VLEVSAMSMMGASAGLTLRQVGLLGSPGDRRRAALIRALHVACSAIDISTQIELQRDARDCPDCSSRSVRLTPAMTPSVRSRGVATAAAIVSGLAPGR
jgi:hypothetical protein